MEFFFSTVHLSFVSFSFCPRLSFLTGTQLGSVSLIILLTSTKTTLLQVAKKFGFIVRI